MKLFDHQTELSNKIDDAWAGGERNVMVVSPTGSGKTVLFSHKILHHDGYCAAIAHRQELVTQMSITLARNGVRHRVIAPRDVIKNIVRLQMDETGKNFYHAQAPVAVVGVHTLAARTDHADVMAFVKKCTKWVVDEGHHVTKDNLWGRAIQLFQSGALGLMPTATPCRADRKGLGRHADGIADVLIEGPSQRWLIDNKFLCDYRLICRPSDMKFDGIKPGATGDYSHKQLRQAAEKSHIVGDVADHYLKYARGKLGVTFAPDVETGREIVAKFLAVGVPAKLVTADTPDAERYHIKRDFQTRKYLQLVNVDLFGEGFDLPAIEVVSMARRTESLSLYMQQFGRALRTMQGKTRAIVIDHVNNWERHGLPDKHRVWTLERGEKSGAKNKDPNEIPLTCCGNPECAMPYERFHVECPYCGHRRVPVARSGPEFVDGDLAELDGAVLAQLRGEVARIDGPCHIPQGVPAHARDSVVRKHHDRQQVQALLRDCIAQWAGYKRAEGRTDREIHKLFYLGFGVDVMSAQALGVPDAMELMGRVANALDGTVNTD